MIQNALFYGRVSTTKQKTEGHGLESQEHRCKEFAQSNNWKIVKTFKDDYTGGGDYKERPAMQALLKFLDDNPLEEYIVIFDDLKRLARDTISHWALRKEFETRGAKLHCLNFQFEESPEGRFVETIIASVGELERKQNQRQVVQKMKARLENGYWVFQAPLGYDYIKDKVHGKLLAPKEPECWIVKSALEKFSNGVIRTKEEFKRYLIQRLEKADTYSNLAETTLKNGFLYSGFIKFDSWGIQLIKGHHKALISPNTFATIQDILEGNKRSFVRQDNREEFALRGFVKCTECNRLFTAAWATGRSQKYPYYRCMTHHCQGSIKKGTLEDHFCQLLEKINPSNDLLDMFSQVLESVYQSRVEEESKQKEIHKEAIKQLEQKQQKAIKSALEADISELKQAYESEIMKISKEIEKLKIQSEQQTLEFCVGTAFLKAQKLLKSPLSTWKTGSLRDKQMVQNLAFQEPLAYNKTNGFGTARFSHTYNVLASSKISRSSMVDYVRNNWNQIYAWFQRIDLGEDG